MTTRHVQENLDQRDDFIAPNTFLAVKREVIRFDKLTSKRTDEFSEADLRQLIEDFKKGNPLLKKCNK